MAKFTQLQLGHALGLEGSAASARMSQYESGKHAPDYQTAKRMAQLLDVPVAYLYCDDEQTAQLLLKFHKLTDADKQALLAKLDNKTQS